MPNSPSPSPVFSKNLMISDLSLGTEVNDLFIIASAQQGQARNGLYWRIEFRDSSGGIGGKIWSPQSQAYADLPAGSMAQVKGRVSSYRDQLELSVEAMRLLDDAERAEQDLSLFMPASPHNPDQMMEDLLRLAAMTLQHEPWRRLIISLLKDEDISRALRLAPAAKAMHHAYAGGLLEHTLSVARLCMRMADHYPRLDRQALFAGAVCHDLGKLWELSSGFAVEYTQAGKLLGHISLLMDKLGPFIRESALEPELAEHLQHMILSHHGSYEFGSPRLPATAEALALHYADILDAKLQQVENALSGLDEQGWSPYVPALERSLFRAKRTPEAPGASSRPDSPDLPKTQVAPEDPEPFPGFAGQERDESPDERREAAAPDPAAENKTTPAPKAGQPLSLFSQCSLPSKE